MSSHGPSGLPSSGSTGAGGTGLNGSEPGPAPAGGSGVLVAEDLTKHFVVRSRQVRGRGRHRALVRAVEHVDVRLETGHVTALVGESGCGKTTVSRMMARLIKPTAGRLLLEGVPVRGRSLKAYRAKVQMVFQDPFSSLNPVHDVEYHLSRPLRLYKRAGGRADVRAGVYNLLERVKLEPPAQFVDKLPHELSGGQRQRVAIARALAAGPTVLLADEPVSMLDVSIRLGVLNLIDELRDQEGLAILYVTHDIASARYFANTMMVMYAGRVIEYGPSREVTDQPAHPYTQLLLSAAPDPHRVSPVVIQGGDAVASLVAPPSGCRFHPRCPHAMPVCSLDQPPDFPVAPGHWAACWLHDPNGSHATPPPNPQAHTPKPQGGTS